MIVHNVRNPVLPKIIPSGINTFQSDIVKLFHLVILTINIVPHLKEFFKDNYLGIILTPKW